MSESSYPRPTPPNLVPMSESFYAGVKEIVRTPEGQDVFTNLVGGACDLFRATAPSVVNFVPAEQIRETLLAFRASDAELVDKNQPDQPPEVLKTYIQATNDMLDMVVPLSDTIAEAARIDYNVILSGMRETTTLVDFFLAKSPYPLDVTVAGFNRFTLDLLANAGEGIEMLCGQLIQGNSLPANYIEHTLLPKARQEWELQEPTVSNVRRLGMIQLTWGIGYLEPGKQRLARPTLDLYGKWYNLARNTPRLAYNQVEATPDIQPSEEQQPLPINPEIHEAQYGALLQQYDAAMLPFRPPFSMLRKQGYRELTRELLHTIRKGSSLEIPSGQEETLFVNRITGVLYRLSEINNESAEDVDATRALLAQEQTMLAALSDVAAQLRATGATVHTPAPLADDISWINDHLRVLGTYIKATWPEGHGQQAYVNIEQALERLQDQPEVDERRLLVAAQHLGFVALPADIVEARPTRPKSVILPDQNEAQSFLQGIEAGNNSQNSLRSRLIQTFMKEAAKAFEKTGDESYRLYYTGAPRGRDRFFFVKYQDTQGSDWLMFEGFGDERATYILPLSLVRLLEGPFPDKESELEAAATHSKSEMQGLASLGDFQAQIPHTLGWTLSSHMQKIEEHMARFRPESL